MTGRLHVYAWHNAAKVYRHLGSLPADAVPDAAVVAGLAWWAWVATGCRS